MSTADRPFDWQLQSSRRVARVGLLVAVALVGVMFVAALLLPAPARAAGLDQVRTNTDTTIAVDDGYTFCIADSAGYCEPPGAAYVRKGSGSAWQVYDHVGTALICSPYHDFSVAGDCYYRLVTDGEFPGASPPTPPASGASDPSIDWSNQSHLGQMLMAVCALGFMFAGFNSGNRL